MNLGYHFNYSIISSMINFSLSDLRLICDGSTFSRGYDYNESAFSQIKSTAMISEDIMQILSTTTGSKLYKQTINIYNQDENIKVIGRCSCPVGRNCKHVISSCLAYLDNDIQEEPLAKNIQTNSKDTWMQDLQDSFLDKKELTAKTSTVLLYILHPSKNGLDIELSVYTARVLKSGGYGKVNRSRPASLFNISRVPEYIKETDKEVITLFRYLCEAVKTTAVLKGRLGALVLQEALKTKRCYWQKAFKTNFESFEDRELELTWKKNRHTYSIDMNIENSFILATEPLYYIDTILKRIGKVDSDLSMHQYKLLNSAPEIDADEIKEFIFEFADKFPNLHIKEPVEIDLKTLSELSIKPILHLSSNQSTHKLKVYFDYEDYKLNAYPRYEYTVFADDMLRVKRDLEKEDFFTTKIKDFGFNVVDKTFFAQEIISWKRLLDSLDELKEAGFEILKDDSFNLNFSSVDKVNIDVKQSSHWFELGMNISVEDKSLELLPILSKLLSDGIDLSQEKEVLFDIDENTFVSIPADILKPILKTFYELLDKPNHEGFKVQRFEAGIINNFENGLFHIKDKTGLKNIADDIKNYKSIATVSKGLKAELREYQKDGVAWMQFLRKYGFGGILADDMGLGKTIQTLAFLQIEKEQNRLNKPTLIVAPTSLLSNWKNEANKFTPNLKVCLYYGAKRERILADLENYDLIITTYNLVNIDVDILKKIEFYYLILDEAQRVKNIRSASHKSVKELKVDNVLALSGTPMENHLGELHSIFNVVMPALLGTAKSFKTIYQNPIEKGADKQAQDILNSKIKPFMLRRTKNLVASELPKKSEIIRYVPFKHDQANLYETIRVSMQKSIRDTIKNMGLAKSHISILAALLKLRQVCCDPRLLKIQEAHKVKESAKLTLLMELVDELLDEGRNILIFSQFTSMLSIIETQMQERNVKYSLLTGATRNREKEINNFSSGKTNVFLISLKAGGVGLNLTAADTVIHYDPWWNPAVEAQATDRAYRIGQDKPVFVYKLIIENSVEEKILKMQADKKELASAIYNEKEEGFKGIKEEDLISLFS